MPPVLLVRQPLESQLFRREFPSPNQPMARLQQQLLVHLTLLLPLHLQNVP
jgi:hypothetical protein